MGDLVDLETYQKLVSGASDTRLLATDTEQTKQVLAKMLLRLTQLVSASGLTLEEVATESLKQHIEN